MASIPRSELEGEFKPTLTGALAHSLRKVMEMSGRPNRTDYHWRETEMYEQHMREWKAAKDVLAAYDTANK